MLILFLSLPTSCAVVMLSADHYLKSKGIPQDSTGFHRIPLERRARKLSIAFQNRFLRSACLEHPATCIQIDVIFLRLTSIFDPLQSSPTRNQQVTVRVLPCLGLCGLKSTEDIGKAGWPRVVPCHHCLYTLAVCTAVHLYVNKN